MIIEGCTCRSAEESCKFCSPVKSRDYTIEHAEYLAQAAENYLMVRNEYDKKAATDGCDTADIDLLSDHFRALNSAIYEFRKRASGNT